MSVSNLRKLEEVLLGDPDLEQHLVNFEPGQLILRSGESNDYIFLILLGRGDLEMVEAETDMSVLKVGSFGRGDFLGLASFWNQEPNVADARAVGDVQCLVLDREQFSQLSQDYPEFNQAIQNVFISNLSHRYRRGITLNRQIATLSRRLEKEGKELKQAIQDLERAQQQLISQEKLVTLGQLISGLAHELNNPAAALGRNFEHLLAIQHRLLGGEGRNFDLITMLQAGMDQSYWTPEEKRHRLEKLQQRFPEWPRSLCRRLVQAPDALLEDWIKEIQSIDPIPVEITDAMDAFELGLCLRSQRLSVERITQLVTSLKNYSRTQRMGWQLADIREGIRDTVHLLKYRLKNYALELDLDEIPDLYVTQGELNQVWTNLIVNAMHATKVGGRISIKARLERGNVIVEIIDEGCGIPDGLEERIFESEFSTRTRQSDSGLGLGLTITRGIVERHGGCVKGWNRAEGGAVFQVRLPLEFQKNSVFSQE
jgi:two-component system NtrC family sensor kinase